MSSLPTSGAPVAMPEPTLLVTVSCFPQMRLTLSGPTSPPYRHKGRPACGQMLVSARPFI